MRVTVPNGCVKYLDLVHCIQKTFDFIKFMLTLKL